MSANEFKNFTNKIFEKNQDLNSSWSNCSIRWYSVDQDIKYGVTEYGEFIYGGVVFATINLHSDGVYSLMITDLFSVNPIYAKCVGHWFTKFSEEMNAK